MTQNKDKKAKAAPVKGAAKAVEKIVKETAEAIVEETVEEVVEETVEETILNPTQLRQLEAKKIQLAAIQKAAKNKVIEAKEAKVKADDSEKEAKEERPFYTDEKGLKFRFKTNAPKSLNVDGNSRLISELIEEADVMLELINGNNNLIEQI